MSTIQESLDALVTQTTGLTNTVSGRITDMDGKITQANSAQVAAETAKTNAEIAETSAQTAQSLAETARDVASTAKVDAQTAKSDSLAAQSAASAAQTSAEAARDASIAADVSASTNRSDSITAKNASVVAQGLSETAEVNAAASAAAANSHKTKAGQWADNAEDASVETGKYSAKHWSAKAAIENAAAGVSENNALASKNAASASEGVATTKASESSTSATASAASASTATTKASEAVGSANTAATQAGISTTKASEASSSASAAASSASSAASAATTAVNAVIDTAPANLNTLNELAAALGDDANYASTTTTALGNRYTKAETDGKIVELSPPATKSHVDSLGINAGTLTGALPVIDGSNLTGISIPTLDAPSITGTLSIDSGSTVSHTISNWSDDVTYVVTPTNCTIGAINSSGVFVVTHTSGTPSYTIKATTDSLGLADSSLVTKNIVMNLSAPTISSPADTTVTTNVVYTVTSTDSNDDKIILDMGTSNFTYQSVDVGSGSKVGNTVEVTGFTTGNPAITVQFTALGTYSSVKAKSTKIDASYGDSDYSSTDSILIYEQLSAPSLNAPADTNDTTAVTYTISSINANSTKVIFDAQSSNFTYGSVGSGTGTKVEAGAEVVD